MDEAIKRLVHGNDHFRNKYFKDDQSLFQNLITHGQQPKIMIVACSDSRVDPALIFNCEPGELFIVRSVSNLIPPYENNDTYHGTSAALEFGVCFLNISHLMILGHTQCGGIRALVERKCITQGTGSFIDKWMDIAQSACDIVMHDHINATTEEKVTLCMQNALHQSLKNLKTFPWIAERVEQKKLSLHAWYFSLETGELISYDKSKQSWDVVSDHMRG